MTNLQNKHKYDLEERTVKFAEDMISFLKTLRKDSINNRIIDQLVGSSGSVGANYAEAIEGESIKDFIHKVSLAKKEIKETKHWLRLLLQAHSDKRAKIDTLTKEAQELLLIFSKIVISSKSKIQKS